MFEPPPYPFIIGHENAGLVVSAPQGATVSPGERVAVYNMIGCGTTASMLGGIRGLARHGTLVLIGYTAEELRIHPVELILSEARIVSSVAASRRDLETAVQLAGEGRLPPSAHAPRPRPARRELSSFLSERSAIQPSRQGSQLRPYRRGVSGL